MKKLLFLHGRYFRILFFIFFPFLKASHLPLELAQALASSSWYNPFSIIDENVRIELQLDLFIDLILQPTSELSRLGLKKTMIPLNNKTDILERQDLIKQLVENNELLSYIQHFSKSNEQIYEKALYTYWDADSLLQQKIKSFYFPNFFPRAFNKNPSILQLGLAKNVFQSCQMLLQSLFLSEALDGLVNSIESISFSPLLKALKEGWKHPINLHSSKLVVENKNFPPEEFVSVKTKIERKSGGDWYVWYAKALQKIKLPQKLAYLPTFATIGILDYIHLYLIVHSWENLKNLKHNLNELEEHTLVIAEFFQQLQKLAYLLQDNPTFSNYSSFQPLFNVGLLRNCSPQLRKVIELLLPLKANQKIKAKFKYGHMLLIHRLLQEAKQDLIPLFDALSELHAYFYIAQMVKLHQNTLNPYCFTTFLEEDTPAVNLTDFWLPLVPTNHIVTNSIVLGGKEPLNTLFTGPHWCGKSISMKGIAYSVMLSHACGIAPARESEMTFFTGMRTAINIADNVIEGQSGFSAEKKRLANILTFMKTARPTDHYFILLDEPITKTMPELIGSLVYNFGLECSQLNRCITLLSCNHQKALELTQTPFWASYYVELLEPEKGSFVRTFKLLPGISTWWTSSTPEDVTKRARFINWIGKHI
jgi:hypothetical protein